MIALDTNVLVRYMMQDDPKQSPRATRLIEALSGEEPGFVPLVALVELVWVLSGSYGLDRAQVSDALDGLLRSVQLRGMASRASRHGVRTHERLELAAAVVAGVFVDGHGGAPVQ